MGYRSSWDSGDRLDDGSVHYHDAPIVGMAVKRLEPGQRTTAEIDPILPTSWDHGAVGIELRMCEGRREVGIAVVRLVDNVLGDIPGHLLIQRSSTLRPCRRPVADTPCPTGCSRPRTRDRGPIRQAPGSRSSGSLTRRIRRWILSAISSRVSMMRSQRFCAGRACLGINIPTERHATSGRLADVNR